MRTGDRRRRANAAPRRDDARHRYYHGTTTEAAARSIVEHGLRAGQASKGGGPLAPVSGKVYLTRDLEYAIIYALGGSYLGRDLSPSVARSLTNDGRDPYGYVFVIQGTQLVDIQPDEDSIGEMVSRGEPRWLRRLAEEVLSGIYTRHPDDEDDLDLGMDLYEQMIEGEYNAWAEGGKILLDHLDDDDMLALIDAGAHVAHHGGLVPSEIWRIDKVKDAPVLDSSGRNFFEVAERIKGPGTARLKRRLLEHPATR